MAKVIGLVGHCGPDGYMLRSAVKYAVQEADVRMLNDDHELKEAVESGTELLLINRVLDGGFMTHQGVELIRRLKSTHPQVGTMLVSNFPEAQAQAVEAGARVGFGKNEIGSAKMKKCLADAVA